MIVPWVKNFAQNIFSHGPLGVCQTCCRLQNMQSGSSLTKKPAPADRFTVIVPYAGEEILWEVIFNHNEPDHPPDFIFDQDEFDPDIEALPHLVNWDPRDPMSLYYVLEELYDEYRKFQTERVLQNSRLQFEYTSVVPSIVKEADIEPFVYPMDLKSKNSPIGFVIKLTPDYSRIPDHLTKELGGPELAILKIYMRSAESSRMTSSLTLSTKLEQVFGGQLKIPACPIGACLMDYVPEIVNCIEEKMEMLDDGINKRKAYVECLEQEFSKGLVEVDTVDYFSATLLMNYLDFNFIVQISIPTYFPREQPKIILRSVYHTDESDSPYSKTVRGYPWSPRWAPEEMVKRLLSYLQEIVPTFQKTSVMQGLSLQAQEKQPPEEINV